jgi:hypothetical protein
MIIFIILLLRKPKQWYKCYKSRNLRKGLGIQGIFGNKPAPPYNGHL